MKKKIWKTIFVGSMIVSAVCICAAAAFLLVQILQAPKLSEVDAAPEGYLSTILDQDENVMNTLYVTESNRIYVGLENIPKELQEAFIAIEDARFYSHQGIDLKGIVRAVSLGIKNGGMTQGASTITQQLLKNNVFTDWMSEESFYDSLCRKVQEQFLAVRLEQKYSKDWILENYLNTINLGGGTRGVQVAAQYYFGKDVSKLSLAECALIAGITKNPTTYNPLLNPEKSLDRQELVLQAMLDQGYISQEQHDAAVLEDVIGSLKERSENAKLKVFSWFEDALLLQIVDDLTATSRYSEEEAWNLIYSGGLTIYSTQDTKLQHICESEATNSGWYSDDQELSVVMTDVSTGAVLAIVGSSHEKDASLAYNRATDAVRQPGSTMKVIGEYAAALDKGMITLGTVVDDAPYQYSNGTALQNSYTNYKGMTTIRDAIASSSNVVALKTYQMAGERTVFEYLEKFGLTTLTDADKNEAISIGGTYNGVTNLEMTAAYNAIANDGKYIRPFFYTKVVNRDGEVILENKSAFEQIIGKSSAQLLTSAMKDVITKGTGQGAAVSGVELAGKSGTTNEKKDLWFVGYSSEYTCGVWGGYDDNSAQSDGTYVKKIWKEIMREAHSGMSTTALINSDNLINVLICKKCGNLAVEGLCDNTVQGNMTQKEYFANGTEPNTSCDCHVKVSVCNSSNAEAGVYCPNENVTTAIYLTSATEGTEDAKAVVPENIGESCEVHKHFWNQWFENESSDEPPMYEEPAEPEEPEDSWWENSNDSWWEDLFGGWF